MAFTLTLATYGSSSGQLTVYNNLLPGDIKRVFYISGAGGATRGGHRHHKAWNALICLVGSCSVYIHNGGQETDIKLDSANRCLILEPADWHVMEHFSDDAVLLVLSNEAYDREDYIDEPYPSSRFSMGKLPPEVS